MSLAIFDAGGAGVLCDLLLLAAKVLADPPGRRPRGRRLSLGMSEADSLKTVFASAQLVTMALYYALLAGRDDQAIDRDGIDHVARAVLDAGGYVAAAKFVTADCSGPAAILRRMDDLCEEMTRRILEQLSLRPRALAEIESEIARVLGR